MLNINFWLLVAVQAAEEIVPIEKQGWFAEFVFDPLSKTISSILSGLFLGRQDAAEELATSLTFIFFCIVALYILKYIFLIVRLVYRMWIPLQQHEESGVEIPEHLRDRYKP